MEQHSGMGRFRIAGGEGAQACSRASTALASWLALSHFPCRELPAISGMPPACRSPGPAGLGFGLPLSRLYARYFGGDLRLVNMPG